MNDYRFSNFENFVLKASHNPHNHIATFIMLKNKSRQTIFPVDRDVNWTYIRRCTFKLRPVCTGLPSQQKKKIEKFAQKVTPWFVIMLLQDPLYLKTRADRQFCLHNWGSLIGLSVTLG